MIELGEAWGRVAERCQALPAQTVALADALGRVAAADVDSPTDQPPFDRSAMDGWAVRAAETDALAPLSLAGDVAAGTTGTELAAGTAVGISTGAAIPPGADAVLPRELGELSGNAVTPTEAVSAGRHIRRRGEDLAAGDTIVAAGSALGIPQLSALASAGAGEVEVHGVPRVSVLVTGSELLPAGAPAEPGRVHESNGLTLRLLAERAGAVVTELGVVGDDAAATRDALARGLENADVLIISGGVSVGEHDHVRPALAELGVEEIFWRVRVRPGKPVWFGVAPNGTLVFGLPGNPLSVLVCFLALVEPALRRLAGDAGAVLRTELGRLSTPARAPDGRITFLTAQFMHSEDGVTYAIPHPQQGSHLTGALARADGFAIVDGEQGAGALVQLVRL